MIIRNEKYSKGPLPKKLPRLFQYIERQKQKCFTTSYTIMIVRNIIKQGATPEEAT
jgi:hypothetical protein